MQPLEKIKQLFNEIKKGKKSVSDTFFETIWVNLTTLAHDAEIKPFLQEIYDWAKIHDKQYEGFFELVNLSIGHLEFLADDFENAMKHLNTARKIFSDKKDEDGVAACSITIGYIYRSTGEIDLALKYGLPSLEHLAHSGKYKMFQIIGSYWIGGVYAETGHLEEALHLFKNGLKVDYPLGIKFMGARLSNGIAGVYMKQKNFSLALENYHKALDLCETTTENTFRARGLTDLGDYYCTMGDYEQAIRYNQEALNIRQDMKIQNGSITNLINLGDIYRKQGKFDEAVTVLMKALKIAEEIRVKVKMYQIHQLLSDILLGMGNTSGGLAHFKAFHEIREEVNHEDLERKVKNQVKLFQAEQTKKENVIITAQKKEIEKKNIELQETIDELTITKISKKAKVLTLGIAIILFIFAEQIIHFALHIFGSENYLLSLFIKVGIVFSLKPFDEAVEHYLLRKVIKKKNKEVIV